MHDSPDEVGIDALAWTSALVQQYLEETYDVEYSLPGCRRLLKEAGLSDRQPRRTAAEADEDEREESHGERTTRGGRWTPPCLSRSTHVSRAGEPRAARNPRSTRPAVERTGQHDWTCSLDVITEDGDRLVSRFEAYVTAEQAKHLIFRLCEEFKGDLIVVLDGVPPYF